MSLLVQRPDVSEFRRRFRWLTLVVVVAFLAIVGRVVQLQLVHRADYQAIAKENIVRKGTLATTRGVIRDRNGKVLAASRPAYNLFVVPKRVTCAGKDKRWPCPEPTLPREKAEMAPQWVKLVKWMGMPEEERLKMEEKLLAIRDQAGARRLALLRSRLRADGCHELLLGWTHHAYSRFELKSKKISFLRHRGSKDYPLTVAAYGFAAATLAR